MDLNKIVKGIDTFSDALQAGNQLRNPSVWADRASSTASMVVIVNSVAFAAQLIGVHLPAEWSLSATDVAQVVSIFGVLASNALHIASNKDAGNTK